MTHSRTTTSLLLCTSILATVAAPAAFAGSPEPAPYEPPVVVLDDPHSWAASTLV